MSFQKQCSKSSVFQTRRYYYSRPCRAAGRSYAFPHESAPEIPTTSELLDATALEHGEKRTLDYCFPLLLSHYRRACPRSRSSRLTLVRSMCGMEKMLCDTALLSYIIILYGHWYPSHVLEYASWSGTHRFTGRSPSGDRQNHVEPDIHISWA